MQKLRPTVSKIPNCNRVSPTDLDGDEYVLGFENCEDSSELNQECSSAYWVSNSIDCDDHCNVVAASDCNQVYHSSLDINCSIHSSHDALPMEDCVDNCIELPNPHSVPHNVGCSGTEEKIIMSSKMMGDLVPQTIKLGNAFRWLSTRSLYPIMHSEGTHYIFSKCYHSPLLDALDLCKFN